MHPVLFEWRVPFLGSVGPVTVYSYGVLLAAAYLGGLQLAMIRARRRGLDQTRVLDLGIYIIISALIGAKLLLIVTDYRSFFDNPRGLLDLVRSGGVFYGGLIVAVAVALLYIRRVGLPLWTTCDVFAPGIALGHVVGRFGCFFAGCCWGKPTDLPWGVHFTELGHEYTGVPIYGPDGSDLYLHPTQLYESFFMLAVFAFLYYLHRKKKFNGQVLIAYAIIYSIFRFCIEFIRDDPRGDLFGLTSATGLSTSQLISLVVAVGSIVFLIFRLKRPPLIEAPAESE